jgi:hypothetical protein
MPMCNTRCWKEEEGFSRLTLNRLSRYKTSLDKRPNVRCSNRNGRLSTISPNERLSPLLNLLRLEVIENALCPCVNVVSDDTLKK